MVNLTKMNKRKQPFWNVDLVFSLLMTSLFALIIGVAGFALYCIATNPVSDHKLKEVVAISKLCPAIKPFIQECFEDDKITTREYDDITMRYRTIQSANEQIELKNELATELLKE